MMRVDFLSPKQPVPYKLNESRRHKFSTKPKYKVTNRPESNEALRRQGDMYVSSLLIQGAKSAVMTAHRRKDPISRWVHQLYLKSGWQKAVMALVNKNARILWAVMVKDKPFGAHHISVKPMLAVA